MRALEMHSSYSGPGEVNEDGGDDDGDDEGDSTAGGRIVEESESDCESDDSDRWSCSFSSGKALSHRAGSDKSSPDAEVGSDAAVTDTPPLMT